MQENRNRADIYFTENLTKLQKPIIDTQKESEKILKPLANVVQENLPALQQNTKNLQPLVNAVQENLPAIQFAQESMEEKLDSQKKPAIDQTSSTSQFVSPDTSPSVAKGSLHDSHEPEMSLDLILQYVKNPDGDKIFGLIPIAGNYEDPMITSGQTRFIAELMKKEFTFDIAPMLYDCYKVAENDQGIIKIILNYDNSIFIRANRKDREHQAPLDIELLTMLTKIVVSHDKNVCDHWKNLV